MILTVTAQEDLLDGKYAILQLMLASRRKGNVGAMITARVGNTATLRTRCASQSQVTAAVTATVHKSRDAIRTSTAAMCSHAAQIRIVLQDTNALTLTLVQESARNPNLVLSLN